MTLFGLVVLVALLGLCYWGLSLIVPQPFLKIILVLFIVICILAVVEFVLSMPGIGSGLNGHIFRR
jgi:hypothetical protein